MPLLLRFLGLQAGEVGAGARLALLQQVGSELVTEKDNARHRPGG